MFKKIFFTLIQNPLIMSCCNLTPYIPYQCEDPIDRVERDLKHVKERLGIDLSKWKETFLLHNHHYVIESFPRLIGSSDHTKYDLAIFLSRPHEYDNVIVINSLRKTFRMIPRSKHKSYSNQWLIEADSERAETEKNEWRQKLKSVGINVQW